MKLVVGLGNPGPRYSASRHNIGFRILARLASDRGVRLDTERFGGRYGEGVMPPARDAEADGDAERLGLLEPHTFMNRSGESVVAALDALPEVDPACDLVVVYDDLDLPLGRIRLRPQGGAGGHRGVESVIEHLGSGQFPRLRFGIGRPPAPIASDPAPSEPASARGSVVDFVLDGFSADEEQMLSERIPDAARATEMLLRDGAAVAMDRFNRVPDAG